MRTLRDGPAFSHSDLPLFISTQVRVMDGPLELIPPLFRRKAGVHPGEVTSPSQGRMRTSTSKFEAMVLRPQF